MKSDSQIQQDVIDELNWEPAVNAAEIGVEVKDGIVTLAGHVSNYPGKWNAERAAERVYGKRGAHSSMQNSYTKHRIPVLYAVVALGAVGVAHAAPSISDGSRLYAPCVVCHQPGAWGSTDGVFEFC